MTSEKEAANTDKTAEKGEGMRIDDALQPDTA